MILRGYFRSSAAFRVRIALNLKGLAYEDAVHHLRRSEHLSPAYLALNPQGLVPALETHGAVLTQSLAIIEFLDETYPTPPLLPSTPIERAAVRALAQAVTADIHPLDSLRVLRHLRHEMGQPEDRVRSWYNHWIDKGFEAIEALLAHGAAGRFCHGDTPGLADICLVPQVINARTYDLDLAPYPTIARIARTCLDIPAFERALPANQPDAEPD